MAILVSEIDKRIHWLEAAARWLSLGREQGVLLPRRSQSRFSPRGLRELRHQGLTSLRRLALTGTARSAASLSS